MKRILTTCVTVAIMASACTSGGEPDPGTTSIPGSGDTSTTVAAATSSTTTTASATMTSVPASSTAECVVGIWKLDSQAFLHQAVASLPPAQRVGEFRHVGGANTITMGADGTFIDDRDAWSSFVSSDSGEIVVTTSHLRTGTYTVVEGRLSASPDASDPPEIELPIDAVPIEFPAGLEPAGPPSAEFVAAAITCADLVVSATMDGNTSTW